MAGSKKTKPSAKTKKEVHPPPLIDTPEVSAVSPKNPRRKTRGSKGKATSSKAPLPAVVEDQTQGELPVQSTEETSQDLMKESGPAATSSSTKAASAISESRLEIQKLEKLLADLKKQSTAPASAPGQVQQGPSPPATEQPVDEEKEQDAEDESNESESEAEDEEVEEEEDDDKEDESFPANPEPPVQITHPVEEIISNPVTCAGIPGVSEENPNCPTLVSS